MDRFSAVATISRHDEPWSSLLATTHLEVSLVRFSGGSPLSREVEPTQFTLRYVDLGCCHSPHRRTLCRSSIQ